MSIFKKKEDPEEQIVASNFNMPVSLRDDNEMKIAFVSSKFKTRGGFLLATLNTFKRLIGELGLSKAISEMEKRID